MSNIIFIVQVIWDDHYDRYRTTDHTDALSWARRARADTSRPVRILILRKPEEPDRDNEDPVPED